MPSLTQSELLPIVQEALARWKNAGLDAATLARMSRAQFVISDLPGAELGEDDANIIVLDGDAAGHGWFVDPTPALDEEFASAGIYANESHRSAGGRSHRSADRRGA